MPPVVEKSACVPLCWLEYAAEIQNHPATNPMAEPASMIQKLSREDFGVLRGDGSAGVMHRMLTHTLGASNLPIGNEASVCISAGMMESMSAEECVFCRVVDGTVESSRVYEDDEVLAFMDIQPVTDGHLLVIPKRHAPYLADLDEQLGMAMFHSAQRLAGALRNSGLPCEGVNLFLADGEAAFQEVFHVHLHVFPRMTGDGFRIDADWRERPRAELDDAAERIRGGMGASPA